MESAIDLAIILAERQDLDGAESYYMYAIERGDADSVGRAQLGLGLMLASVGKVEKAERLLEAATKASDIQIAHGAFGVLRAVRRGNLPRKPWEQD
jgi:Flp pilus assembly protein TadD